MKISVQDIASKVEGRIVGQGETVITGVNSLESACEGEISFYSDSRYKDHLLLTRASAIIVRDETSGFDGVQIVVSDASLAYVRVAELFAPPVSRYPGASGKACIHESSKIGIHASIYPNVYIDRDVVIGEDAVVFPGTYIGEGVSIGARTVIYPNVCIHRGTVIGNDVIINAGSVIGGDGFGYARQGSASVKIPQLGIVQIDDNVEIGANNCIDRATFGRTWIKRGVKTDNLVQIAHNVVVGEDSILVAQVGISGSVKIGKGVIMAGQVGISDHLEIGDRVMIGPQAGVAKSVPEGQVVSGSPSMPHSLWLRVAGLIGRLPQFAERLRRLEKRVEKIDKSGAEE